MLEQSLHAKAARFKFELEIGLEVGYTVLGAVACSLCTRQLICGRQVQGQEMSLRLGTGGCDGDIEDIHGWGVFGQSVG